MSDTEGPSSEDQASVLGHDDTEMVEGFFSRSPLERELADVESGSSNILEVPLKNPDQDDVCPICMGAFENETFIDGCFHRYCFTCILVWCSTKASCPLCKAEITSLIHDITKDHQFRRFDVKRLRKARETAISSSGVFPSDEHRLRRSVYNRGLVARLPGTPNSTPAFSEDLWEKKLKAWVRRELQALMGEENVDVLLHFVHSLLKTSSPESLAFQNQVKDFLGGDATAFGHELGTFMRSQYDIRTYDRLVMYPANPPPPSTSPPSSTGAPSASQHPASAPPTDLASSRPLTAPTANPTPAQMPSGSQPSPLPPSKAKQRPTVTDTPTKEKLEFDIAELTAEIGAKKRKLSELSELVGELTDQLTELSKRK